MMARTARILAWLVTLTLAGCDGGNGSAGAKSPEPPTGNLNPIPPNQRAEQLWLQPPAGWRLVNQSSSGNLRQVRYQHPDDVNQFLAVESLAAANRDEADPLQWIDEIEQSSRDQCPKLQSFHTFSGIERGFPTAVRLLVCPPGKPQSGRINLLKVIAGQQASYLVGFEKNWTAASGAVERNGADNANPADQPEVAAWSLFLRKVYLCAGECAPASPITSG